MSSVCSSVTLVDQDHIGWKSWKLIARTIISTTYSLSKPIGTHQRSFEQYHTRPPTASSSPRLGVRNPLPKLQSLLSQERVKLRTSNFVRTFIGLIGTKAHQSFGKRSRGRTQGLSKILQDIHNRAHRAVIFAVAQLSCILLPLMEGKLLISNALRFRNWKSGLGRLDFVIRHILENENQIVP